MASDAEFILKAANLARSAPQAWREFLEEFAKYAERSRNDVVSAPPDKIFVAQGHAQRCDMLLRDLRDCIAKADQVAKARGR